MKILCLIDSLGPGGAQRQLVGLSRFLKEEGLDVKVATYHNDSFYVGQLKDGGVPYELINNAHSRLMRPWQIAQFIKRESPNVVISYLEAPSIYACLAHFFNRKFKLIVSERNTTQKTSTKDFLRFLLYRCANYIVPNSYSQEVYIKKFFPFLSYKVITIPNFVDLDYFRSSNDRKRKSIPEIMIAASIWPSKNTLGFIEAVAELKRKASGFHISWYGKDLSNIDYFNQCQRRIVELNVEDVIELKEKTHAIRDKYNNADYFCLPSFYEGTPNVICEALSCGLPIACSNVCDNGRYVFDDENGFLFNPCDIYSIETSLYRALSLSESDYEKYSRCSRLIAEKMLSKEKFVESYLQLIKN